MVNWKSIALLGLVNLQDESPSADNIIHAYYCAADDILGPSGLKF